MIDPYIGISVVSPLEEGAMARNGRRRRGWPFWSYGDKAWMGHMVYQIRQGMNHWRGPLPPTTVPYPFTIPWFLWKWDRRGIVSDFLPR